MYADIRRDKVEIVDDFTKGMRDILDSYEHYKNQFFNGTYLGFPSELQGT